MLRIKKTLLIFVTAALIAASGCSDGKDEQSSAVSVNGVNSQVYSGEDYSVSSDL